jgi:diguanylate cyclase (GGDEF)-like protein
MPDARLDELRFLTRLERERLITFSHRKAAEDAEVRIAIQLLAAGVVNDATVVPPPTAFVSGVENPYLTRIRADQWEAIERLHSGQEVRIRATHAAAVRRAELEQSIQRDRLRDHTGILFDGRYAERDLQIATWLASKDAPVSVAYLDMNGLKEINDSFGHTVGTEAITAFFEVIAAAISENTDAYRVGGDEVVIVVPGTPIDQAARLLRTILQGVSGRRIGSGEHVIHLSAVAGLTIVDEPREIAKKVIERADGVQYKAKQASKSRPPERFGALAIENQAEIEEFHLR